MPNISWFKRVFLVKHYLKVFVFVCDLPVSTLSLTIQHVLNSEPPKFPNFFSSPFDFISSQIVRNSRFSLFLHSQFTGQIEELVDDTERSMMEEENNERQMVRVHAKKALVGAGARILFYPTLLYNVLRNKIETEFRWWDQVDEFLLLGAVPFPKHVPQLKQLGVGGVITLNEPYETLVPSSLYHAHGIDHLVIPTRDYLFAPSFADISRAVQFIHQNACSGKTTYVHCKAGRGRSTTIVLCYLVEYKHMTPVAALEYVRSRRPRVLLAPTQWKAVQSYHKRRNCSLSHSPSGDAVIITKADLEGYHGTWDGGKELAIVPKVPKNKPMIARLSCLFASLKVSGSLPMTRRLPVSESRAC